VKEIDEGFTKFFETLRHVIERVDSRLTSEDSMPTWLDSLGENIKVLRVVQDKRLALWGKMQALLNPQRTTTDPTPPLPLPESSGGSDES
jgi:hypothetical protein